MIDTKALREKVLDLAIRGKLVPQDPNDEPASVLLERIRAEKQQMVKDGKLKPKDIKNDTIIFKGEDNLHYEQFQDGTVKCIEDEIPFDVPDGWEWCRLNNFTTFIGGYAYKSSLYVKNSNNLVIRIGNIKNNFFNPLITKTCISNEYAQETQGYKIRENDILFTMTGTKGKRDYFYSYLVQKKDLTNHLFLNQRVGCLRTINKSINVHYMLLVLQSSFILNSIFLTETGSANQGNISSIATMNLLIPLPPSQEQNKIVTTIENCNNNIVALEDELKNVDIIISTIKSKILDLAIRGKLVPQNPNDEPASVLLERIREEKEDLIKQGKIKRDKRESIIFKGEDNSYYEKYGDTITCIDSEIPFEIPDGWTWCRLQDVCTKDIKRGKAPKYSDLSDTIVFAQKCNTKTSLIDISKAKYLDDTTLKKYLPEDFLHYNDIIINSTGTGTLGRIGIFRKGDNTRNIKIVPDSHITTVRVSSSNLNSLYVYYFLKYNQSHFEDSGVGSTNQKELKPETVSEFLIAIPPMDEQTAIIRKISELFSSFDCIEAPLK